MTASCVIVVGASAGGVDALKRMLPGLPADLPAAVLIVLHTAPDGPGLLPEVLGPLSRLPVAHAVDGEVVRDGRIYVAPPDRHMVVDGDQVRLTRGPREHFSRPAIDPLFRSAARVHGDRAIGVVLSGCLDDGTAGLWAIKRRGGRTFVQDPGDARYPSMPRSASAYVPIDHRAPAAELGPLLVAAATTPSSGAEVAKMSNELEIEDSIAKGGNALGLGVMSLGPISPYTCPECQGVLVSLEEDRMPRFRCHTGHAYSLKSLLSEVTRHVESSLWSATRAVEGALLLMQHAARHLLEEGNREGAAIFANKAKATEARAQLLRDALDEHEAVSLDLLEPTPRS